MDGMTVRLIDDASEFLALRDRWNDLLRSSRSDNPFLTWEWLYAWWTQFGVARHLRLIVVQRGDTIMAIAPLHLVASPLYWFSRLEFLGTGEAGSDYLDLIIRRGYEPDAIDALALFMAEQRLTVRLTHLPPGSLALQLARRLTDIGWTTTSSDDGVCPIVTLSGHTFDSFLGSLGSSHRANVRRRLRALERQFQVSFTRIVDDDERQEMLRLLAAFHASRYRERGGSTAFTSSSIRSFHEAATGRALECGWLNMYALRLDDTVAAVMYGFNYGGRFYFYQHGYDDRYSSHSIGLVLMALTVQAAIADGALEFDMLWGTEAYKALWARETRGLQRIEMFPLRLGEAMHRHAADARRGVAQLARRVLSLGSPGAARVT